MKKFNFAEYTENLKHIPKPKALNTKKLRKSILIICEGEKTEPYYFKAFKKRLPKEVVKQVCISGTGRNTTSLVKAGKDENLLKKKRDGRKYDQTWIVMDRDSFSAQNVNEAHEQANLLNFKMAFSNESFELWYLLHFIYLDTTINRKQYNVKLNNILKLKAFSSYSKISEDMYIILRKYGNQKLAIKYAKRLYKIHEHKNYSDRKPSTTVFKLVELLNGYIID